MLLLIVSPPSRCRGLSCFCVCVCVWQVEDVRYLVEMVWASRSVLHGSGDLYDLVLVRWDRWREWSPWNCILLSKNEAKAHTELEDINKVSRTTGVPARLVPI